MLSRHGVKGCKKKKKKEEERCGVTSEEVAEEDVYRSPEGGVGELSVFPCQISTLFNLHYNSIKK